MIYPKSIASLIEHFQKFPSVGPKSAQRMAFYLLRMPMSEIEKFAQCMISAKQNTKTPTLIEFIIDPEDLVYPMVKPGGALEELIMDC